MKTKSSKDVSRIGIGSFGIGGRGHRDVELTEIVDDQIYIDAVAYALVKGSNFTEISLGYGHGNSLKLFKSGLDQSFLNREDIFISHSLYVRDLPDLNVIHQDTDSFLKEFDYADSTLVTQSLILKFGETQTYGYLHEQLKSGLTRYVSLSNASPTWIKKFKDEFSDKFIAHEGHLSFEIRALQDKGVFKLCDQLDIQNIIWRPLGRNLTLQRKWPMLTGLSGKYGKSQSQVIINWMCNLGYKPMIFSTQKEHIDENLSSADFEMSKNDYQQITNFRPTSYNPTIIDWEGPAIDDDIVRLVKEFDNQRNT